MLIVVYVVTYVILCDFMSVVTFEYYVGYFIRTRAGKCVWLTVYVCGRICMYT